jgi:multiple antibiotic resistance protein
MNVFWFTFIPLFVAVDAIGVLPFFINLTEGLSQEKLRKIIIQSTATAMAVALVFIFGGKFILDILNVTVADFMIAGGTLLFVISLNDMLSTDKKHRMVDSDSVGAVPIGVPLIVGPAVLTTALLLLGQYGPWPTLLSAALNILIAGGVFFASRSIYRVLGKAGAKTVSKIAALILAAIGVMMVRKGIMIFIIR